LKLSVGLLHPNGNKQSAQFGKGFRQLGQLDILGFCAIDAVSMCGLCFAVTPNVKA